MQESVMQRMWDSAHLSGGNAAYVEELYELYLHDPNAVPEEWRTYFQKLPVSGGAAADVSHSTIRDHFVLLAKNNAALNLLQPVVSVASMRRNRLKSCALFKRTGCVAIRWPSLIRSACSNGRRPPTWQSTTTL